MAIRMLSRVEDAPFFVHSWVFSFALHGLMVGAVVALLSELQPRPQPEPFTWRVAFADAPVQSSQEQTAPAAAKPTPTASPIRDPPPPAQPATQAVEPSPSPATPSPQAAPVIESTPPRTTVQASEAPRPAEVTTAAVQSVTGQEPVQEERPETHERQQPIQPAQEAGHSTAPVEQAQQAAPTDAPPLLSTPAHSAQAEPGPPAPAQIAAASSDNQASAAPALVTAKAGPASARAGKADHRWLAEALWHRIQHVKQYPKLARNQGWEGRVVVRVLIKEDGSLLDANVVESSGFDILDLDAIDLVRQVCPLTLKQALGQAHVAIHIPIQYRLDQ